MSAVESEPCRSYGASRIRARRLETFRTYGAQNGYYSQHAGFLEAEISRISVIRRADDDVIE
jgi:hypothetical protein